MDAELQSLCVQTVLYEARTSHDVTGKPGYAAAVAYKALVQWGTKYMRMATGEVVATKGVAYLVPIAGQSMPVQTGRFTLPSGYVPQQPLTLGVDAPVDERTGGTDHYKILFG